jgi:hypothetical protein
VIVIFVVIATMFNYQRFFMMSAHIVMIVAVIINSDHKANALSSIRLLEAALPTATPPHQPHDDEQQHGADCRSDDCRNNPGTKMNAELRK